MSAKTVAGAYRQRQVVLARRIAQQMAVLWRQVDVDNLDASWSRVIARMLALLTGGQALAAGAAEGYLAAVADAQGLAQRGVGSVNPRSFAGVASDGRELRGLLYSPVAAAKIAIRQGHDSAWARRVGALSLDMITRTQIADAGRSSVGVGIVARPQMTGYVRMLNPPSCARCVILAGRWYPYSAGFLRHPNCDCVMIPGVENTVGDLRTDPMRYIRSIDEAERVRILGKAGAQAVADGADLNQVVNARRGMATANVAGRRALITTEGITRRGLAGQRLGAGRGQRVVRLMPEQIYADAERLGWSRDELIRQLVRFGYILMR